LKGILNEDDIDIAIFQEKQKLEEGAPVTAEQQLEDAKKNLKPIKK
jgi:hypothetical protein